MKKRIASIVMLVVLVAGIVLAAVGASGRGIYDDAATRLGFTKKEAMGYIQSPETLKELPDTSKMDVESVRGMLVELGADGAAFDAAIEARGAYEAAVANAKNADDDALFAEWQKLYGAAVEDATEAVEEAAEEVTEAAEEVAEAAEEVVEEAGEAVAEGEDAAFNLFGGVAYAEEAEAAEPAEEEAEAVEEEAEAVEEVAEAVEEEAEAEGELSEREQFEAFISDRESLSSLRNAIAQDELGVSDEEFQALADNTALLTLYRDNIPNLLNNSKMTSSVLVMFCGFVLIVAAGAYFLIAAMSLKPRARTRAANPKVEKITTILLNYALFIILGLILIIVSIIRPDFLSMSNILNILQNASTKGILALGCAGLIVLAGTDLSIGRVLGISAAVTASMVQSVTYVSRMYPTIVSPVKGLLLLIPLFSSIAVAVLFCMINGFGVAKLHLHAFIVTLGTQLIAYGVNCLYIESQPSGTAQALSTFDSGFLNVAAGGFNIGSVRVPIVVIYFLVLALIMWVIWNKTTLGKNMFAVGGNTEAAAVSGVNVAKTIMLVYLMAGVLYGISSFLEAARITSVGANTGLNYETDAISAVVVGGVSFSGGVGTIQGVVIGAIILQAINYALQFLGVNPYIQYIIRGLIIILAVSIDVRKYIVKK